jgi:hypothetical protein
MRMVNNLPPDHFYQCIVNDFVGAWDSIAQNRDEHMGRGNFIFARQAMNLLEFAAILYGDNPKINRNISEELCRIEPKYFTLLPSPCAKNSNFVLPYTNESTKDRTLLWALFDLVRHGLAHQYQQLLVNLTDKKHFYISLTGAVFGRYLEIALEPRPMTHLAYKFDNDRDLEIILHPEIMFLDFKKAIDKSGFIGPGLSFEYFSRPIRTHTKAKGPSSISASGPTRYYDFNTTSLEESLKKGGHIKVY